MTQIDHIAGHTFHSRKGAVKNAFRYSIDYVICDAEADVSGPSLFGRNAGGVMSLHDSDHGGVMKAGTGAAWVRAVLAANRHRLRLVTLPDRHALTDLDTPEAWAEWQARQPS